MTQSPPFPPQHQDQQPGIEAVMNPRPLFDDPAYRPSGRLQDKVALITGGDSGIGRAIAVAFAKEGADVAISYLSEESDATETRISVEACGRRCLLVAGDIGDEKICYQIVVKTLASFGKIDILVNNAAEQHPQNSLEDIAADQLEKTFRTNVFAMFYMTKSVLPHLNVGGVIVNTTSVTAYQGSPQLLDYSASKGAIVAFTRSLSKSLMDRGIRVNAVAPGPIWTPFIPSSVSADQVPSFGADTPMKRAGQPQEVAPAYVFLASSDSSYMSGQVLHVNGGTIVNG